MSHAPSARSQAIDTLTSAGLSGAALTLSEGGDPLALLWRLYDGHADGGPAPGEGDRVAWVALCRVVVEEADAKALAGG